MGIVYQAHEVRLDRPVALKVLPPECVGQSALRERFLREARTAAKLSHPNIVPIFAVDEVDDLVFFAMGYIEGETLGQRVRERGPLRPTEAGRMLREVAWALGHAHLHGVVHRDVKPDNILIESGTGRAMVTDFGIAHISETKGLTGAAEILGTADFMSPEQSSGDAVDGRSDLYSLGVVGYYVLTGALPFHGATIAATLGKHLTQQAPVLVTVAPEVPRHLSQTIDRCLAKDPSVRFQTGEALAEALTESLAVRQEMPGPMRVFVEQSRAAGSSVVALGLLVVTMLVIWTVVFLVEGFSDWADIALGAVFVTALAATPVVMLARMARQLLQTGYGHAELLMALRSDVDERRKQLAAEYGDPSLTARWAKGIALGSTAAILGSSATLPFLPPHLWGWVGGVFLAAFPALIGSGLVAAASHQMRAVTGARWLRFWESRIGRGIFKVAKLRLGSVTASGPAYGPTVVAIGMASRRLFEALPKDLRRSFSELPDVLRDLEQHGARIRARVEKLGAVLTQIETEQTPGERDAASTGLANKRSSLRDDVLDARRAADVRLGEVVQALETIRLELLRMHAGGGSIESVTADLTSARQLSEDIERRLEGTREVGELLGGAS
jgi:serine/threonine-protein kinase